MATNQEEKQYESVTNLLSGLKKISVPPNFDADLMRRINSEKYKNVEPWWKSILNPRKLVPSAALALTTIAVLFVLDTNQTDTENPLLMKPRLREDVTVSGAGYQTPAYSGTVTPVSRNIIKSGLNFRQLRLTAEEREKIEEMKQRLNRFLEKSGRE